MTDAELCLLVASNARSGGTLSCTQRYCTEAAGNPCTTFRSVGLVDVYKTGPKGTSTNVMRTLGFYTIRELFQCSLGQVFVISALDPLGGSKSCACNHRVVTASRFRLLAEPAWSPEVSFCLAPPSTQMVGPSGPLKGSSSN